MKIGLILGTLVLVALIFLYEWPRINRTQKKEKAVFVVLLSLGTILAIVLVWNPDLPGPTQMVDYIYKPLGRMMEK
jgi:multisubunit Na+/H+ antiporter MnhB subunit